MFANRKATAMLPAKDVDRAVAWYADKLGLKPAQHDENGASFAFTGVNAFLYKSEYAGTAQNTAISFDSPDLEADMPVMRGKGVVFLDYDLPGLKTVNHVFDSGSEKCAWFRDTEGNYLCLHQSLH